MKITYMETKNDPMSQKLYEDILFFALGWGDDCKLESTDLWN